MAQYRWQISTKETVSPRTLDWDRCITATNQHKCPMVFHLFSLNSIFFTGDLRSFQNFWEIVRDFEKLWEILRKF
jgi:hypothetical protein